MSACADLAIVLVGAGRGMRMGFDKVWYELEGRPLVGYAVEAALVAEPAELVLVVSAERVESARQLAPMAHVVPGGGRRRDSTTAGLAASSAEWVAIHDAARFLVRPELFARGLEAARQSGAAIPVVPLKDTVKRVSNGRVVGTINGSEHVAVQTPQVFRRDLLQRALALSGEDVTDESALVELLGVKVSTFHGAEENLKVTTPLDLDMARVLLSSQAARL